ncbi:hypothetical protein BHF71_10115 [Vulcanibacillus modesticaldus]|uniref:Uncharacterized protein n=1 Tax=Vulcanibacillus modesticaldus TaxID=337097 RepID=A0A1D2YTY4_9BACI|nr:hypothetical protein BHF71_10115 [Vulcanibacillus modesticaldus]
MTDKEKLYYLIREFIKGNYTPAVFCNEFTVQYNPYKFSKFSINPHPPIINTHHNTFEEKMRGKNPKQIIKNLVSRDYYYNLIQYIIEP